MNMVLQAEIPDLKLNGHAIHRLPNTLNVSFPDRNARLALARLADLVAASAGSACHSDSQSVSGVLGAMGIAANRAGGAVRLSVGIDTTHDDVVRAAKHLVGAFAGSE